MPRALDVLAAAGFSRDEDAPEDWLAKVWDRGNLVDLIFRLSGEPVTPDIFDRVDQLEVGSVQMPVLAATDLVVTKLLTYRDHYCDFATLLPMVRALREQVDWPAVRERTARSPYAEAFVFLADRLGLTDRGGAARRRRCRRTRRRRRGGRARGVSRRARGARCSGRRAPRSRGPVR